MLSDIENLDILLDGSHFDREESEDSILARRPEIVSCNSSENNEENPQLITRENRSSNTADHGQNSAVINSIIELNRLSSELSSRISKEMDEMMNSVSVQIQRAINDAISKQVLPQIQNAFKAGSRHVTPENNAENYRNDNIRSNSRSRPVRNRLHDDLTDQAYDNSFLNFPFFRCCTGSSVSIWFTKWFQKFKRVLSIFWWPDRTLPCIQKFCYFGSFDKRWVR